MPYNDSKIHILPQAAPATTRSEVPQGDLPTAEVATPPPKKEAGESLHVQRASLPVPVATSSVVTLPSPTESKAATPPKTGAAKMDEQHSEAARQAAVNKPPAKVLLSIFWGT